VLDDQPNPMNRSDQICPICNSQHLTRVNSYKHHCYVCSDCNNVFHIKKEGKYLLERLLPRSIFKRLLPPKAFLRLFHDKGDISAADFYDVYADECRNISEARQSEVDLLLDQLSLAGIGLDGKSVLDISGGPGVVARRLKDSCAKFVVTEFSEKATRAMHDVLDIETLKFDYTADQLQNVVADKFDLVLIRSSIIFCPKLDEFVASLRAVLNSDGHVLVETIMPTLGDVLWWQQMEYKFPIIYSQETIEKYFYKHGFSLMVGYRDYGSYTAIKGRATQGVLQKGYTWLIDYPMVLLYYLFARKGRVAVDQRLNHKMLTQIWKKTDLAENVQSQPYRNYEAGPANQSTHFAYTYNGYLRK
jgi:2-polyprenyl-3-methyl-5-hydroxy-6-metoxy-1,4-benzoquinol methylase